MEITEQRIKSAIWSKIRCLTKYDAQKYSKNNLIKAYRNVLSTELYKFIVDPETRMYIEPIEYVYEAYDLEKTEGYDAMLAFIQEE